MEAELCTWPPSDVVRGALPPLPVVAMPRGWIHRRWIRRRGVRNSA